MPRIFQSLRSFKVMYQISKQISNRIYFLQILKNLELQLGRKKKVIDNFLIRKVAFSLGAIVT
jgi:hypothetical protein